MADAQRWLGEQSVWLNRGDLGFGQDAVMTWHEEQPGTGGVTRGAGNGVAAAAPGGLRPEAARPRGVGKERGVLGSDQT